MMKTIMMTASLTAVIGCGGGGGGGGGGGYYGLSASEFVNKVNDELGYDDVDLIKTYSSRDGWIVIYDEVYGYRAVDLDYLRDYGYSSTEAAEAYLDDELYDLGVDRIVSPSGNYNEFIDDYGYIYEESTLVQKDLELVQALIDLDNTRKLGETLSAEFGLSEDAGMKVARISSEWEKLSQSRAMTDADVDALTSDLFGINLADINDAQDAFAAGDTEKANDLLDQAAESLQTSPENFRSIVFDFVADL